MDCPKIGFGTYKLFDDLKLGVGKFYFAIEKGYRLIDTAEHYNNQKIIGKLIRKMRMKRGEIFLVSKVWRNNMDYKSTLNSVDKMLTELQTNYIDCVLIHWPNPIYNIVDTLGALKQLKSRGYIKSYGVSNFGYNDLKNAINKNFLDISYNQLEFHPLLYYKKLKLFCDINNIKIMSHTSLANGRCIQNTKVIKIAKKYNITPAQVTYAWLINKNITPITGLGTGEQIIQNLTTTSIILNKEDINFLDNIKIKYRALPKSYQTF